MKLDKEKILKFFNIIVALIIIFFGFKTAHTIFVLKEPNAKKTEAKEVEENLIPIANDLMLKVPHAYFDASIYNKGAEFDFDLINKYLIFSTFSTLREITSSENEAFTTFQELHQDKEGKFYLINKAYLENEYRNIFSKTNYEFVDLTDDEVIISQKEEDEYFIFINDSKYKSEEKISTFSSIEEEDNKLIIKETVLFLEGVKSSKEAHLYVHEFDKVCFSLDNLVCEEGVEISSLNESYKEELFNKYKTKAKTFTHTFIKQDKDYFWESTT